MCPGSGVHTDVLAARTTCAPGRSSAHGAACRPWPTATRHQLVVGGVVLDLVDAVTVAVVGVQHRPVAVGEFAPALRLRELPDRAPSSLTSSSPHSPPSRISASMSTGEVAGL